MLNSRRYAFPQLTGSDDAGRRLILHKIRHFQAALEAQPVSVLHLKQFPSCKTIQPSTDLLSLLFESSDDPD